MTSKTQRKPALPEIPTDPAAQIPFYEKLIATWRAEAEQRVQIIAEVRERRRGSLVDAAISESAREGLAAIDREIRLLEGSRDDLLEQIVEAERRIEDAKRVIVETNHAALLDAAETLMARIAKRAPLLDKAQAAHAELLKDHIIDMADLQRALRDAHVELITDTMVHGLPEFAFATAHAHLFEVPQTRPVERWIKLPQIEMRRSLSEHIGHVFAGVRTGIRRKMFRGAAPQAQAAD